MKYIGTVVYQMHCSIQRSGTSPEYGNEKHKRQPEVPLNIKQLFTFRIIMHCHDSVLHVIL